MADNIRGRVAHGFTGGEGVTAGDNLAAGGAAGPSSVAPSHPLLMGRAEGGQHGAAAARGQGRSLTRQRGFRYIQLNPRSHGAGHGGNSQILQQLLGPSNGRDIFQFTESTRVLVMDSGFAILDSDEISGFDGIGQSSGTALSSIPSALVRWNEESRVLDGDSLHDCMTVCKPDILDVVEKHREEELAERREKKKKDQEEKDTVRKMDEEDTKKKEPEMATTPAPSGAGVVAISGSFFLVSSSSIFRTVSFSSWSFFFFSLLSASSSSLCFSTTSRISGLQTVMQSCSESPSSTRLSSFHLTRALGMLESAVPLLWPIPSNPEISSESRMANPESTRVLVMDSGFAI